jgi:hypothetical protein
MLGLLFMVISSCNQIVDDGSPRYLLRMRLILDCLILLLLGCANGAPVSVINQPAERETYLPG